MLDTETTPIDGRVLRSRRTKLAIVDALIALLEEGSVQPTVEEIAARAGVAPRTVFQHYADREALFTAVAERRAPLFMELLARIPDDGSLEERIEALVEQRRRLYEAIAPVRRGALLMEPFSASTQESLAGVRRLKRDLAVRLFAAELDTRPAAVRDELAAAVGHATSFAAWNALRTEVGLSPDAAAAVTARTLRALLRSE